MGQRLSDLPGNSQWLYTHQLSKYSGGSVRDLHSFPFSVSPPGDSTYAFLYEIVSLTSSGIIPYHVCLVNTISWERRGFSSF